MKKVIIALLLVFLMPALLFAVSFPSLYTLDVPYTYQNLYLSGNLGGNDAFEILYNKNLATPFSITAAVAGDYYFINHTENTHLDLSSRGSYLQLGSTGLRMNAAASGDFKSYAFSIGSFPAYYQVAGGVRFFMNLPFDGGASSLTINLSPAVGAGIGKMYFIGTIKKIVNTMEHFGVTPTEAIVEKVARQKYTSAQHFNTYSSDSSELYGTYYRDLAHAYTIDDKVVELIYLDQSQEYSFEAARWNNLMYGWQAYAQLRPSFSFTTGTKSTFKLGIALGGEWATLLAGESVYVKVGGELIPTIDTAATKVFNFLANANVDSRYFFDNPRMWIDSSLGIGVDTNAFTKFNLNLSGIFNYLIAPNFTVYGGLEVFNTFDIIRVVAGGNIRLF
ncbi:MAG: hypothetical protein PHS67_03935 [Sphaerochaetaceae bacterium]|nr:hypothetical protein [Sphaerochaetaceae bacterium]